ncbi:MAG: phosphoenolpyruvate--protein phosphotransferase [Thermoguttaceae bacterium]|nr:phosphoenolpyruvate--protein phosphotransferase [Thermoguttaceae bacterium]
MKVYQGVPVYPGVAIGKLSVVVSDRVGSQKRVLIQPGQVDKELRRIEAAFRGANAALETSRDDATRQLGAEFGRLYEAYLLILNDAGMRSRIEKAVSEHLVTAEYAVDSTLNQQADLLRNLDPHYAERANDILDLRDRLLHELLSIRAVDRAETTEPTIVAASFLKPSAASKLDPAKTSAIVTENGAIGSHTAIVAAALHVPTVLGVGSFLTETGETTVAIVDGELGRLVLDPTPDVLAQYERKLNRLHEEQRRLESKNRSIYAKTLDGVDIEIKGNIEFPQEAKTCYEYGAPGVGLYRTEFLYLTSPSGTLPNEEAHFEAYKQVAEAMNGRQVTIRTFDLGADKLPNGLKFTPEPEPNPFLGLRSVRLSLRNGDMFRTQIRALLRASVYGKIAVMFPLVSTIMEFRKARMIFNDVRDELLEKNVPFDRDIPLGIMVETPAAVITLEQFAHDVDFFSIGTNDLLQYAMATDRTNPSVSELYEQESPALLRMIKRTVDVARTYDKPVSLCGQMGSVPENIPLLLGLGLRTISVAPGMILRLKEVCEGYSIADCQDLAARAALMESSTEVRMLLRNDWHERTQTGY